MATVRARVMSLGDGSEGTGPAICLSILRKAQYSDDETPLMQVLVNCGECACRILNETRTKLSRVTHLLFTRCEPTRISGASSLLFHLSDKGSARLSIVGPAPLASYVETIRTFVRRRFPEIEVAEVAAEDGGFAFESSTDDPDTFAWAQSRAPHTGVSIHAIPMSSSPNKRQKTGNEGEGGRGAASPTAAISYAFVIRGPQALALQDSDVGVTIKILFVVVDHAGEHVESTRVYEAICSWLRSSEMMSTDGSLKDDLHQKIMLHVGTRRVLSSAECRGLREHGVFQSFHHVELQTVEKAVREFTLVEEQGSTKLDPGHRHASRGRFRAAGLIRVPVQTVTSLRGAT